MLSGLIQTYSLYIFIESVYSMKECFTIPLHPASKMNHDSQQLFSTLDDIFFQLSFTVRIHTSN